MRQGLGTGLSLQLAVRATRNVGRHTWRGRPDTYNGKREALLVTKSGIVYIHKVQVWCLIILVAQGLPVEGIVTFKLH